MADLQDVLEALSAVVEGAVYPTGIAAPSVSASPVRIAVGWPLAGQLEDDLAAGVSHISIFPMEAELVTTRYFRSEWEELTSPVPTITAQLLTPYSFSLGGAATQQHNIGVSVDKGGVRISVSVPVLTGTMLPAVAVAIALQLSGQGVGATASGAVVTLSAATVLEVNAGTIGTVAQELRRQSRPIRLMVWSSSLAHRRILLNAVDLALAKISFLPLADGTSGYVRYNATDLLDTYEKEDLYRADLIYEVEYATVAIDPAYQIVVNVLNVERAMGVC